jgi:serine/threonine protein kinase
LEGEPLPEDAKHDAEEEVAAMLKRKRRTRVSKKDDVVVLLIKYVKGKSFEDLERNFENLPPIYLFNIAINLCKSLQQLHSHNWVHKDIHGYNILIYLAEQEATLIDYGNGTRFIHNFKIGEWGPVSDISMLGQLIESLFKFKYKDISNKQLEALIKKMQEGFPLQPPLVNIVQSLEDFKKFELAPSERNINVGYLSMEFADFFDIQALVTQLTVGLQINEIYLIDNENNLHSQLFYQTIKRELEQAGILVHDQLITYPTNTPNQQDNSATAVLEHANLQAKTNFSINHNFLIVRNEQIEFLPISNGPKLAGIVIPEDLPSPPLSPGLESKKLDVPARPPGPPPPRPVFAPQPPAYPPLPPGFVPQPPARPPPPPPSPPTSPGTAAAFAARGYAAPAVRGKKLGFFKDQKDEAQEIQAVKKESLLSKLKKAFKKN